MTITEAKKLTKEEFFKLEGASNELYNAIQNAKSGFIIIQHKERGDIYSGYTDGFGEGISVRIVHPDGWYITSVIQKINHDKSEFTTLNSVYKFKFIPDNN